MRRMGTMAGALAIVVSACSGAGAADTTDRTGTTDTIVTPATRASAAAPTTTAPASTAPPSTTPPSTMPPTTVPATPAPTPPVTAAPLPVPVVAPLEDGSTEPRIEIGTIEIPRIGLTRSMFEGIRLPTLDHGPGHWPGTAMPGEVGNVVVAGHRVSHNKDFRHLDQLTPGDEVIMSTASGRHVYRVLRTEVVQPDALWIVDQTAAPTATLFACHPPGSVSQRIVVHLELT